MVVGQESSALLYNCESCFVSFGHLNRLQEHRVLEHGLNSPVRYSVSEGFLSTRFRMETAKGDGEKKGYACGLCLRLFSVLEDLCRHLDLHRILMNSHRGSTKRVGTKVNDSAHGAQRNDQTRTRDFSKTKADLSDGREDVLKPGDPVVQIETVRRPKTRDISRRDVLERTEKLQVAQDSKPRILKGKNETRGFTSIVNPRGNLPTKKKIVRSAMAKNAAGKKLAVKVLRVKALKKDTSSSHHDKVPWPYDSSKTKECQFCRKLYSTVHRLKEHVSVVHRRDASFMCDLCCRVFSTSYNMSRHCSASHQTDKGFSCTVCWRRFRWIRDKEEHENVYHGIGREEFVT